MAEPAARQRLYLIDGYSNIFRAFYAIRNLSSSKGEPTNAVYGFVTMLRKLLREENPELVGVALEGGGERMRKERFAEYKANRAPMPEDLRTQIPWIRKFLEAQRIPMLEVDRYEADDVLGTLSKKAADAGYDVVIVSADKDLMQLVAPHVSLYHTKKDKLMGPAEVEEDFGVPPAKVPDVLALMGDSSDNIPGVPGIGEVGARTLITEYGSLENLLEHASEVKAKKHREGLLANRDQAILSKELSTIHCDLDIALDPDALRRDPPDPKALRELYTQLEFFSLADEIKAEGGPVEALPPAVEAETPEAWRASTAGLGGEVYVAVLNEDRPLGIVVGGAAGEAETAPPVYADFRRPGLAEAALASLR
ncbi:MAG TPA: 5'-3' exonuclease H3TH domain-containing protein, partial [Thermoanaerobaculia bacterium]